MANLKDLENAMKKAMTEVGSAAVMKEIGQEVLEMVVKRTRLGYGVQADGQKRQKLKPLADTTKKVRAGKLSFKTIKGVTVPFEPDLDENKVKLSDLTRPSKSNLTMTGQMLGSYKVISAGPFKALIGPTGQRSDGLTNEEVAEFAEEQGRPFAYLTDIEYKRLLDSIRKRVTKVAQSILTKL